MTIRAYAHHSTFAVDDKEAVRERLQDAGVEMLPGPGVEFRDPWGNRVQIVGYDGIQFTKAPNVLRGDGAQRTREDAGRRTSAAGEGDGAGVRDGASAMGPH